MAERAKKTETSTPQHLTAGRIARFWLPLEATWLMMAAEGPFLAAIIARLPEPKENLAAFAVASALAWIVESPIIMMLSASNALVRDGVAYRRMRRFSMAFNAAVTAIMATLLIPAVFHVVAEGGMGLAPDVTGLAGGSMAFLVLWPGAIGFRRFFQGILIREGRPKAVTYGTIIRLVTMSATGLLLALAFRLPGASVGAGAMGTGVLAEAVASWTMARPTLRRLRGMPEEDSAFGLALTSSKVVRFYAPLALTSFLSFFINPLTTFFLARGRALGGEELSHGDAAVRLLPFPRIAVVLLLWTDDEEFPARADLLVDAACEGQLPPDIMWATALMCVLAML